MKANGNKVWKMTKKIFLISLMLSVVSLWGAVTEVTLKEGTSEIVNINNLNRIMVRDDKVAGAKTTTVSDEIMITGKSFGKTVVFYWRKGEDRASKLSVIVTPRYWKELHEILADYPQVKIDIAGEVILLRGMVAKGVDMENIKKAVHLDADRIVNQVHHDPEMAGKRVREKLERYGFNNIAADVHGNTVHLGGILYDKAKHSEAIAIANSAAEVLGLTVNPDALILGEANMLVTVQFVEVSLSKARSVGIDIGNISVSADGGGTFATDVGPEWSADVGISGTAKLKTLMQSGAAKVSYETTIATKSGKPARFQEGGTIYRDVVTSDTVGTTEINYGFIIDTTPKLLSRDKIETEVSIEASVPVTNSADDINISKYSTSSTFTLTPGDSMVLSGLKSMIYSADKKGTPLISKFPVIGKLFTVDSKNNEDRDALLIITVDWHNPDPEAQERLKQMSESKVEVDAP